MAKQTLMTAMDAKRMLAIMYTDLKVEESGKPIESEEHSIFGTYIDDNDVPVSLMVVDRSFAAFMGGAMTLVPQHSAQEALESGDFPPAIIGNLREVMNIFSRFYMEGSSPHLRFAELRMTVGELTPAEQSVLSGAADRLDMKMDVPGYGGGYCSLITL